MSGDWLWVLGAVVGGLFLWGWLADRRSAQRREQQSQEYERTRYSHENVAKVQREFDANIAKGLEISLPDAVRGRALHIYRHLMVGWFSQLDAQNRYDEEKSKRIRQDWVHYLYLLEHRETAQFLEFESENSQTQEKYRKESQQMAAEVIAIENGFAYAIGPEAVAALAKVRAKSFDEFSREGDVAPEGHYFRWNPKGPETPVPRPQSR